MAEVAQSAREAFGEYRRIRQSMRAGQEAWLKATGQTFALWRALGGTAADESEELWVIEQTLHNRKWSLEWVDKLGFMAKALAVRPLPEASVSCEVPEAHAVKYVRQAGAGGSINDGTVSDQHRRLVKVGPGQRPGMAVLSVTRPVCDCAEYRRQCEPVSLGAP